MLNKLYILVFIVIQDEIDALLKSSVLRDGKSSREIESFWEAQNSDSNNERAVIE